MGVDSPIGVRTLGLWVVLRADLRRDLYQEVRVRMVSVFGQWVDLNYQCQILWYAFVYDQSQTVQRLLGHTVKDLGRMCPMMHPGAG